MEAIKQIDGQVGEYPYVSYSVGSTGRGDLLGYFYKSIPECDTIVWRERPTLEFNGNEHKLTWRVAYLLDGKQIN